MNNTQIDFEALGWAYAKLSKLFEGTKNVETALMLDRLYFMLCNDVPDVQISEPPEFPHHLTKDKYHE
jgi:hypothetical protein